MQKDDLISVLLALDPKPVECPQIFIERGVGTPPSLAAPAILRFLRNDELKDLIMRVVVFRGCMDTDEELSFIKSYCPSRVRPVGVYVKIRHLLDKRERQEDGSLDWPLLSDEQLNLVQHPNGSKKRPSLRIRLDIPPFKN